MGTNRLTELLEQTSADLTPPQFAATAWAEAGRVRRRRRIVAAGVAVLVAAATPVVILQQRPERTIPVVAPSISAGPVARIPGLLHRQPVAGLPGTWNIPDDAPALSANPVTEAVAVAQENNHEGEMRPLHVLDTTGRWVRVDVGALVRTHDGGGNQADPLRESSLSPDRRRVAVPQPQALVVIDLTTGKAFRIPVPGLNEQVMWWGDDIVLVGAGGPGVVRVDWRAATVTAESAGISAWSGLGTDTAAGELPELGSDRIVRVWQAGSARPVRQAGLTESDLPGGFRINEWYGAGAYDGNGRVAAFGWGNKPLNGPNGGSMEGVEMMAVVDTRDGSVDRILDLGDLGTRRKGCCAVLDWIDERTVLAQTDLEGLISWNLDTGEVALVTAGPIPATLSVRVR